MVANAIILIQAAVIVLLVGLLAIPRPAQAPHLLPVEAKRGCIDYTTWPRRDVAVEEACNWTVWSY